MLARLLEWLTRLLVLTSRDLARSRHMQRLSMRALALGTSASVHLLMAVSEREISYVGSLLILRGDRDTESKVGK